MTREPTTAFHDDAIHRAVRIAQRDHNKAELALGYVRYEALRKLTPRQYRDLCARNLKGEGAFDDLVDKLVK